MVSFSKGLSPTLRFALIFGVFSIIAIFVFLAFFIPTARGAEDAASCTGFLKPFASVIQDVTPVSFCGGS